MVINWCGMKVICLKHSECLILRTEGNIVKSKPSKTYIISSLKKADFLGFILLKLSKFHQYGFVNIFFYSLKSRYIMTAELKYVFTQMDEEEDEKICQAEIDDMVKTSNLEGNRKINFDGKTNCMDQIS